MLFRSIELILGVTLRLRFAEFHVFDDLTIRIESWCAGHAAAGMSARSAQIQTFHGRSILRRADEWSESEELIKRHLAVMNVPAG